MTETASVEDTAAAERAAEQARLRKERREAKIKAGGASRLSKISGLGGAIPREPLMQPEPRVDVADPDEVDISRHYYQPIPIRRLSATPPPPPPSFDPNGMSEAQLRQMMLGLEASSGNTGPPAGPGGLSDDPIVSMMTQLLGGNPSGSAPLLGNTAMSGQPTARQAHLPDPYSSLWRLLHTLVALVLGLYIAVCTSFGGTKAERELGRAAGPGLNGEAAGARQRFLWVFLTAETVLLSTRFLVDRGRASPRGVLWSVASFLPQPFRGYVEIALRYGQMLGTIRADVLLCVFVLGMSSWLRS